MFIDDLFGDSFAWGQSLAWPSASGGTSTPAAPPTISVTSEPQFKPNGFHEAFMPQSSAKSKPQSSSPAFDDFFSSSKSNFPPPKVNGVKGMRIWFLLVV